MVRQRNEINQEHYLMIRRARFELSQFLENVKNEVLPELSAEFFDNVNAKNVLDTPPIDRERIQTLVKRAVLRALDVKPKKATHVLPGKK